MPRKSGTGCITCRIRRVKCDETKPACQRCISSKRECDGYLPQESTVTRRQLAEAVRELSIVGPVSQALAQYPQHGIGSSSGVLPSSMALFDVFRNLTAPSTAAFLPSEFWTGELLQLAHSEPAVWHATLALGALHQRHELTAQGDDRDRRVEVYSRVANQNYAQAVTHARELKNPHKLLSLSLALVSITNMMGRWGESKVHIMAGHKLLDQTKGYPAAKVAAEMLTRLDLQAMTFSESSAPYPYQDAPQLTDVNECMRLSSTIDNYGQAGTALFTLVRRFLLEDEALDSDPADVVDDKLSMRSLTRDLSEWEYKMARFEKDRWTGEPAAIYIRLYHSLLRTLITATRFGPEQRWDQYLGHFEHVVDLVDALRLITTSPVPRSPLSLEPGLIIPLFIVISRCRHPALRSRAVHILRSLKRQEGMWFSDGAAAVAARMMAVEGQTLLDGGDLQAPPPRALAGTEEVPWEAWASGTVRLAPSLTWAGVERVPEVQRVRETLVMVATERKQINVTFVLCSGDEFGSFGEARSETVVY